MPTFYSTLDEIGVLLKKHETERTEEAKAAVFEAAGAGVIPLKREVATDTRLLQQSIHAEEASNGAKIVVDAPHAGVVELGARPHVPPLQPLIDWVLRHASAFKIRTQRVRDDNGKVHKTKFSDDNMAKAEGIARAIQAKIARDGSEPTHFVLNQLPRLRDILDRVVKARLKK